jgi:crossover junction endodeoxyribonuclease RuvC
MTFHGGVDLGNGGGFAILDANGQLVAVRPMPVLRNGAGGKPLISAPLVVELLANARIVALTIESVNAMPGEGPVGAHTFGRGKGIFEGGCAALAIPITWLSAPTWRRAVGLPSGQANTKDAARAECIRRWPSQASLFALRKSNGVADASLIALAGTLLRK